jgi:hypothetical protein
MRNALVLSAMAAAVFGGPITYSVSVIPAPTGFTGVTMIGINNSGQVAGAGSQGAFIGSPSGSLAIPAPSVWTAGGSRIDDAGQVTGNASMGAALQAFIFTGSGSSLVPLPAGAAFSTGTAINDFGEVTGQAHFGAINEAYIGTTSGSSLIPMPTGWIQPRDGGWLKRCWRLDMGCLGRDRSFEFARASRMECD